MNNTDEELRMMIVEANKRAMNGRIERLRYMLSIEDNTSGYFSGLAYEYYQEARHCWYVGAFVATIVMSQLALEEMLRSYYRMELGIGGKLDNGKKVDSVGFFDLLNQAKQDDLISAEEVQSLNELRKEYRNPFVHPKDIDKRKEAKSDFFKQQLKIVMPDLIGKDVVEEARNSIRTLVTIFPSVSRRTSE